MELSITRNNGCMFIIREQVCFMEQVAKDILDRNYDLMYDYFCNVLERGEKYKILRARRCQVLFQIFLPIILKNEPEIQIHGEFISSHAIAKYKREIQASSALLLDDIVIHGRGIQELYEELDRDYQNDHIWVYVHKVARNADAMKESFKRKLQTDSKVFDWEWRELSTQLVSVIQAVVRAYVSYVETYVCSQDLDIGRLKNDFTISNNTNGDQKLVGTESFVLFEKAPLPLIIQNGGYDACIRYYKNEKLGRYVLAPYVFVKTISDDDIEAFCSKFAETLSDRYSALIQELQLAGNTDLELKYKTYFINVLLARIYTLHLGHQYGNLFDFSQPEWSTLAMCFGNAVAEDIDSLVYDDICGLLEWKFCQAEYDAGAEDGDLMEQLVNALDCETENEILPRYFYMNREMDEENVRKKTQRRQGLSVQTFYRSLGYDVHVASKMQLSSWDTGRAACDLVVVDHRLVSSYARAGEQSFRYIVEKCKERTKCRADQDAERSGKLETDQLVDRFLEAHSGCLCEWGIPEINY